jgi:hypothetical protein
MIHDRHDPFRDLDLLPDASAPHLGSNHLPAAMLTELVRRHRRVEIIELTSHGHQLSLLRARVAIVMETTIAHLQVDLLVATMKLKCLLQPVRQAPLFPCLRIIDQILQSYPLLLVLAVHLQVGLMVRLETSRPHRLEEVDMAVRPPGPRVTI